MKSFHIGDILSVTTGRLVSPRHIEGVYDILNHLTGDNLFTHQLIRANEECRPWLRAQFPKLMEDDPIVAEQIRILDKAIAQLEGLPHRTDDLRKDAIAGFVGCIRDLHGLPEMIPVYELPEGWHLEMDPVEELKAMVGDDKVIVLERGQGGEG